jgi:UDP-N-acetyl-D-galactosamine dehydrogenase
MEAGLFFVGYSPERVNPRDKEHTIEKVVKVVAGDTPETLELVAEFYGTVVKAGVYKAPDIKTAEAAKVIENIQRDINIALINELALIFHRLGLDTKEVLKAAGTKWNFLRFEPGLVGGAKQLLISVQKYIIAIQHDSRTFECKKEE